MTEELAEKLFNKYIGKYSLLSSQTVEHFMECDFVQRYAELSHRLAAVFVSEGRKIFNRTGEMFRQGDVLIAKIDAIPVAALPAPYEQNHAVLAHGEVTGHKHQLLQEEAQLFAMNDNMFLRIVTPMGYVRHEEHNPIALKQGDYQVIKQREATDNDEKPKAVED